jgi:REase_MTES_1575
MEAIAKASGSPSEQRFFEAWWELTDDEDRPMLFPQVHGHTSGKFWLNISEKQVVALHFDFGLINIVRKSKVLVECDSRKYHSAERQYQSDRDRQNVAEKQGWSVRRFTYEDIMKRTTQCFDNLADDLAY